MSVQPAPGNPAPTGPAPGAPAPKRSWFARHKVLTVVGALVVLVVVISIATSGSSDPEGTAGSSATATSGQDSDADPGADGGPAPDEAPPGIGSTVRDGTFEFTVTSVEPGVARVGGSAVNKQAQGQFVLVHVTVTNTGDQAQWFFASNQTLVDTQGRQHSADESAAIYLDDYITAEINPGNSVQGTVVFDIPADAVPASVELHDSAFSGGVSVTLG